MNESASVDLRRRLLPYLPVIGFALIALVSLPPLFAERLPALVHAPELHNAWVRDGTIIYVAPEDRQSDWLGHLVVVLGLVGAITLRAWADSVKDRRALVLAAVFMFISGAMTACHWLVLDSNGYLTHWQQWMHWRILNHICDAPHQYRPLPYGFTRSLELISGDWSFACAAYRWFFNYWFVWGWYHFARLFLPWSRALVSLVVLIAYYPLSIQWYWGQLTDPLSHSLFVLAMIYTVRDRWWLLAVSLFLGIVAKETVVLMVLVYGACYWRQGRRAWARTFALGLVCVAAFLGTRVPLGWWPGSNADINGADGLMFTANLGLHHLGIGEQTYKGPAPLIEHYLHPLLFVVPFLPAIFSRWRHLDPRLRATFLVLTPLLILSSLLYSWLYESRNYVPLLPLLTTMSLPGRRRKLPLDTKTLP